MKVFEVASAGAPAQEAERPTPELTGTEVLVRITHSGVCHSDVHCAEGFFDMGDAGKATIGTLGMAFPLGLGHEIVGESTAVGPDSTLTPGTEKFIVFPWIGCGTCGACAEDRENYCTGKRRNLSLQQDGGFAREVRSEERRVGKECRSWWAPGRENKKRDKRWGVAWSIAYRS